MTNVVIIITLTPGHKDLISHRNLEKPSPWCGSAGQWGDLHVMQSVKEWQGLPVRTWDQITAVSVTESPVIIIVVIRLLMCL
jgi:hypothetical protein